MITKKIFVFISCLAIGLIQLRAQNGANPTPANDNPLAGLNLGDSPGSNSGDNAKPSPFVAQFKDHLLVMDHGSKKEFDTST